MNTFSTNKLALLPLIALTALALAPGCSSRRARAASPPVAQAPVYMQAPAPDAASRNDVLALDQKVNSVNDQVAALNQKLDEMRAQPAPMPMPAPMPSYEPPAGPSSHSVASGDGEAARFAETLRSRGVDGLEQRGGTVMVRLTDAFRPGSDNLKGDVELAKTLQAVAEGLQLSPGARVQVVGHSDMTPIKKSPWPDNTALSRARAQTVARVLSENGVRSYIDVDGRGESEPLVSPEQSKSDQSKNRRVEVQVTF